MQVLYGLIALMVILAVVSTMMAKREAENRPFDRLYLASAEPDTLNPLTATDMSAHAVVELTTEPLIRRNHFTFELEPVLAESWEISDDNLEFIFHLRKGVRWHDGSEFTSDDVAYSYSIIVKDPDVRIPGRSGWADNESFEIIDKYTVKFRWKKKIFRAFGTCGGMRIIPRKAFGNARGLEFNEHPLGRGCVGTGPYKVREWDTAKKIVLERFDDYWGERPFFERIVFLIVIEPGASLELFKKGIVDLCGASNVAWTKLTNSASFRKKFVKYTYPSFAYSYIAWNNDRVYFKDRRVRRAMTHLIDREKYIKNLNYGFGEIITGPLYPKSKSYNHDIEPYKYDPEMARKLLDEAGWIDRDGDGIRENEDGVKFEFEYLVISGSSGSARTATLVQQELRKLGIIMNQRSLEWSIFLKHLTERNFDATSLGEVLGVEIDHYDMWHSSQADKNVSVNMANFRNKEADKFIEAAREEFDDEKRAALNREFHRIFHEEQPFTVLWVDREKVLLNKRLEDVRFSPQFHYKEKWRAVPWDEIDFSKPSRRDEY